MILYYDLETKSFADLKTGGAYRYGEHETTDVICMAYAADNEKVETWIPGMPVPKEFLTADTYVARNAFFEYSLTVNVLIPRYSFPERMKDTSLYTCTAALSRMHGLPASLDGSAEYLNKTFKKLPDGKRLIMTYSIPVTDRKTGVKRFREIPPDDMKRWLEYDIQDVEADREAFNTLIRLPNFEFEKAAYQHDFALNVKGIRIDVKGLNRLVGIVERATERAMNDQRKYNVTWKKKDGEEYTDTLNVRSVPKLKAWLLSKGFDVPDTRIDTLEEIYENTQDAEVREVLSFRFFLAKASLKKYRSAANRVSPDGRLRYFLKYFGAHTGRYAGEGFQVHNLPKSKWEKGVKPDEEIKKLIDTIDENVPYVELVELGKKILPGLMIPDEGNLFISGDFAAVEARGIAWESGCDKMLNAFKNNTDLYVDMAKEINRNAPNRQLGKAVILGCGYGMGIDKFFGVCAKWGIDVSREIAERAVNAYRTTYPEIPQFWYSLEEAFRATWLSKQPHNVGMIQFTRGGNYIKVKLPSGRFLFYHQVKIEDGQLSYLNFGRKGARVKIWGGVLAENVTQAVCRDMLTDRIIACEKAGLPVMLTVHDEIVIETSKKKSDENKKKFDIIMNTAPIWANGFCLKTESEITRRYHK